MPNTNFCTFPNLHLKSANYTSICTSPVQMALGFQASGANSTSSRLLPRNPLKMWDSNPLSEPPRTCVAGRLIFIHLQCWEVMPFCRFQRQRCIKILCPKDPDFYTPLALKRAKGQHLPALEVYKNHSPSCTTPEETRCWIRSKKPSASRKIAPGRSFMGES